MTIKLHGTLFDRAKTVALTTLISLCILVGVHRYLYFDVASQPTISASISSRIKSGDLIFRQGKGLWSPYFAGLNTKTGFSHLGVIVHDGREHLVLHAAADDLSLVGGPESTPLDDFIANALKIEIRPNLMPGDTKDKFLRNLWLMIQDEIPFDDSFDLMDEGKKVYCTEYIWLAARRAGILDFGSATNLAGKKFILVDSFFNSKWIGTALAPRAQTRREGLTL